MWKKSLKGLIALFFISVGGFSKVYAINCDITEPAPLPSQILCPFQKLLNLSLMLVGAVLIVMIVLGAIKMATALGDPKGLQGAHLTWTYAVIGAFVVVGSFAFILIINNLFGLEIGLFEGDSFVNSIFIKIDEKWQSLLDSAMIFEKFNE